MGFAWHREGSTGTATASTVNPANTLETRVGSGALDGRAEVVGRVARGRRNSRCRGSGRIVENRVVDDDATTLARCKRHRNISRISVTLDVSHALMSSLNFTAAAL